MNLTPHPPTDACYRDHCHSHDIDEPVDGRPYHLACGECYHLFRTRWNLWYDHLRAAGRIHLHDLIKPMRSPIDTGDAWEMLHTWGIGTTGPTRLVARLRTLRRLAWLPFTRPSRIYTCPHCVHDL